MPHPSPAIKSLVTTFPDLSNEEYVIKLEGVAAGLKAHPAFDSIPDFVPHPDLLSEHVTSMRNALAAKASNTEISQKRAVCDKTLTYMGQFLVMKSDKENDPQIIATSGLEEKKRTHSKPPTKVMDAPDPLTLRHGDDHIIYATGVKVIGADSYELQATETPEDESSWRTVCISKSCFKMIVKGLPDVKRFYLRIRGHGEEGPGPWSKIESIVTY